MAQDTFIKALGRMGELQKPEAARAWLFSIAYRCFLDNYKKARRRQALMPDSPFEAPPPDSEGLGFDITRAMSGLADECRACVMLSLSEGYSHPEIESITGLPLGTVKSHISRGKTKLQKALGAYRNTQKVVETRHDG